MNNRKIYRITSGVLAATLALGFGAQMVSAAGVNSIYMDGKSLDIAKQADILKGSTMVPMRDVFEMLGYEVKWDSQNQSIHAYRGTSDDMNLSIGSQLAIINGKTVFLNTAPYIENDKTLVPLRLIAEAAGTLVGWESLSHTVTIDSSKAVRYQVEKVNDEQTLTVIGPDKEYTIISLIGVRVAPEIKHKARDELAALLHQDIYIAGEQVADPYGRMQSYVFMQDGTFLNATVVAEGLAKVELGEAGNVWGQLLTSLESDAKTAGRGLWSANQVPIQNMTLEALKQQASSMGLTIGNVQLTQYITREMFLHMLITALFPELRYVLLAKAIGDTLQNEDVQRIAALAIQKGILAVEELKDGEFEPGKLVSATEVARWLQRVLQLGGESNPNGFKLADFGIFENSSGSGLSLDATISAIKKTKNVYPYLMQYYDNLNGALSDAGELMKYGESTENKEIAKEGQSIQSAITDNHTDAELIYKLSESVVSLGTWLLKSINNGIHYLLSGDQLSKIQDSLKKHLQSAQDSLFNALNANH